jgi:glycosyltransferase involved in cell wall biosynthesis
VGSNVIVGAVREPRIALVTYAMHCGGMESCLFRLARFLHQQGYDVELITTIEPGEWFGRLEELKIRAEHIPGYRRWGGWTQFLHSLRVSKRLARGKYDVILLNHARHAQAALARLPENVVVIPVLHNHNEEIYEVGCANPNAWNVAVAVSPKVAATARQRVPTRPVKELWYGVELPSSDPLPDRRRPSRHGVQLMFVGRLEHTQKGVLWLPEIHQACLSKGIDANLTIVGDGPDRERLLAKLSDLGLENRTRHLKGLMPEQIYGLLQSAHIMLAPSYFEGLPIALLESQACGCVPIASRLPGITDAAVVDGVTGLLVETENVLGFAGAVASLCDDPERWFRMSQSAHSRIKEKFSVEAMGKSYQQLITDGLNGRYPLPRPRKVQAAIDFRLFSWRDVVPNRLMGLVREGRNVVLRSLSRSQPSVERP